MSDRCSRKRSNCQKRQRGVKAAQRFNVGKGRPSAGAMLHPEQCVRVRSRIPQRQETQRRVFDPVAGSRGQPLEYLAANRHTGYYADSGPNGAVLVKAPCDVLAVARSWDDLPVQGRFVCGMSRRSQVCGMSLVFRIKFVWDVSSVSCLWDDRSCRIRVGCRACSA